MNETVKIEENEKKMYYIKILYNQIKIGMCGIIKEDEDGNIIGWKVEIITDKKLKIEKVEKESKKMYVNNQYINYKINSEEDIKKLLKEEVEINEDKKIEDLEIKGIFPNVIICYSGDYNNIFPSVKIIITDNKTLKENEYIIPENIEYVILKEKNIPLWKEKYNNRIYTKATFKYLKCIFEYFDEYYGHSYDPARGAMGLYCLRLKRFTEFTKNYWDLSDLVKKFYRGDFMSDEEKKKLIDLYKKIDF